MSGKRRSQTRRLAICAMLSALGVVLILCSALIDVMDLTMAAIASLCTVFVVIEIGGWYPWLVFAVTGGLSLLLIPTNSGALCYLIFFGYYPIIKSLFERKLVSPLAWGLKMIVFNAAYSVYIFLLPLLLTNETYPSVWYVVALYVGGNVLMFLYDLVLTKLVTLYYRKLRDQWKISRWFL